MKIFITGNPVPQGRPRFYRRGNHVGVYDPIKSKSWKEVVREQAVSQGAVIVEGALRMTLSFHMQRPKSLSKKVIHHTKKPDLDNLIKGIKDALKSVCYHDDSQIVMLVSTKIYSKITPGVDIEIYPV